MTKIFLTGATGYIGGDVLHTLLKSHPEYKVRALVRDASKGAAITKSYSQVQLVTGGLDDADVIAQEAKDADVVLHLAATGHLKSVQTIYETLSKRPESAKPPYYIQISGASALAAGELADKSRVFGTGSDVIYNDLTGIDSIKSLIKQYPSRAVDNYIFAVSEQSSNVKTALVVPPIIYGQGRGPGNQRSMQIPGLAKATLERKKGLQVGSGESRWGNIHIADLSRIFLSLVEKAVEGNQDENLWGANGLFFTGAGELSFAEISRRIAVAANDFNLIPTAEVDNLDAKEIDSIIPHGSVLLGTNARAGADRARKVLGWEPENESLEEHIPTTVIQEAEALGIKASKPTKLPEGNKRKVLKFPKVLWREDNGPWLDTYKEALDIPDKGWKMREEVMKQDDNVPDDEGADDWDVICMPIPGDEENDKTPSGKLASLHPNWPWVFTMRGVDRFKWWRQECRKRFHGFNLISPYGALEAFENMIAHFDSVFQPNCNYRDFWPEVEGLALTLLHDLHVFNITGLYDSRHARDEIVGSLVLATIDALKRQDVFKPNSEIRNLGSVLLAFIHWRLDIFCSSIVFFNIYEESSSWICKVVDLAEEADIELSAPYHFDIDYRKLKNLRGIPTGWRDKWENVDWQSRLRDYKHEKGSDILGGHEFDITKMTEVERRDNMMQKDEFC
ncbi:nucleoside-diphosphate-sugar epimerase [Fusarium napiforme]|uniref:Nucleoside-diphosphate-sugar epimerase n=1 Tax=Fusarium napiforme TaxID=42672 RepID=A0A8H5JUZ2_9HYPO|nr:nucleoside-diphosphate-sugar epimerase [Fusarium napiforme]